ncbi:bifunctional tetrahydrofolate synthase/dihydrofolate synthase [Thalassotalea sp. PLHSN55]|uniref:bifunctional tetrahydrofolate synthase/dihydrofolate synthase n=1 Tax=Thalassotalea sp. PLHSN55 TaxID=3435888 RepID=UPI003F824DF7
MTSTFSSHSQGKSLPEWLSYLESIHSIEIDLGLERIKLVAQKLNIDFSFAKVITVAGTNGKGTTCAFLENALLKENANVAVYSSPHIEHFNERLRVNKIDVDDQSFINAFEQIEAARADISLTYYEFTTLAAFLVLMAQKPDYIILEVGLGGRLDATNMIDADIAVLTSIDLDHQAFLGDTRDAIGYEKAGIMRGGKLAIVGDDDIPNSVLAHGKEIGADVKVREQDFFLISEKSRWQWRYQDCHFKELLPTNIPQANVATALTVLFELKIALDEPKVNQLIQATSVAGRTELFTQPCHILLDVGHNPHAARYLAVNLKQRGYQKISAVVGMLSDKDIANTLAPLTDVVDHWYLASLSVPRGAQACTLANKLAVDETKLACFDSVSAAFEQACEQTQEQELVLVFGSFFTVAEIRRLLLP